MLLNICKKSMETLFSVFFGALLTLALSSVLTVSNADSENCEQNKAQCNEAPAAYQLKIVNSGEAKPAKPNTNPENKDKNRRVDVSIATNVSKNNTAADHSASVEGGATIWLSKDPTALDKKLSLEAPTTISLNNEGTVEPVIFNVSTNYLAFIDRWEVLVHESHSSQAAPALHRIELSGAQSRQKMQWLPNLKELGVEPGDSLSYSVRAYGHGDAIDESVRQEFVIVEHSTEKQRNKLSALETAPLENGASSDSTALARSGISVQGSKVRLLAQNLTSGQTLSVNGVEFDTPTDGRLGLEYILPQGVHAFHVQVSKEDAVQLDKILRIDVDNDYFFMVALADVTAGKNQVSGSVETLAADEQHYGGDIFVDGRLAFYLKGKVRGKYLVTAQMDTGTDDVADLFDNFHQRDSASVFRRIDPDQYYPVYNDASTIKDDTDSQGKLYVRVDWERSRLLWGNYNTSFTGTEFAPFNRSLYGAQLVHRSSADTTLGDEKTQLSVFASQAQSLFRHNEFLGTGGSLYYLRDTDIVVGSEKIWVEVRQSDSERVLQKIVLEEGRDYEIDNFQGRVMLTRPLLSVTAEGAPSIIRDEPLAGNQTFLVVDYEYAPQGLSMSGTSSGVRAKQWLGDHVAVGGTWAHETRSDTDYDIKGADVTFKKSDKTYLKAEYAQSTSTQSGGSFVSDDGGLNFQPISTERTQAEGSAAGVELRVSRSDFNPTAQPLEFAAWAKQKYAGFSTANTEVNNDTSNVGFEAVSQLSLKTSVSGRAQWNRKQGVSTDSLLTGQIDHELGEKTIVSAELRNSRESNISANTKGQATLLAAKVSTQLTDQFTLYGIQQATLARSGTKQSNNATTVGASYNTASNVSVKGEISRGEQGSSALLGTEMAINDSHSVYSNYTYSFNRDRLEQNAFIFGQRKSIGSQLKVFTEHQFLDEDDSNGFGHTVGLEQQFTKAMSASLTVQYALLDHDNGERTERNTISSGLRYQKDKVKLGSKLEYRWDDNTAEDLHQWVTANHFEYRRTPALRWQGKFNASWADSKQSGQDEARFIEAAIGFALRPVEHDRLNMLARLTYLNDLQPESQSDNRDQRSWIASLEGLYDLTRFWSVGAKLAHRTSQIRLERNYGQWLGNDASLAAFRLRYKAPFSMEAGFAYHWLYSRNSEGLNQGAVVSLGRQVGDNLTFSVGYNFTHFDDNLKDDDYDVRGWFVNLIGTF